MGRLHARRCLYRSISGRGGLNKTHPLPRGARSCGHYFSRVPFSAYLADEPLNFLDQDVLALSSSPNCAQPPSHQKRDRVKVARLCLQSSAASFTSAPIGGVTLQVIIRTHCSFRRV